jgi:hypothetical protein
VLVVLLTFARSASAGVPPNAIDDGGFQTAMNTPVALPLATLLANDSDPDGGPISFDPNVAPFANNGSVLFDGGSLVYTPNPGFSGGDAVLYQIVDQEGLTDTAFASVFVFVPNNPPQSAYDEYLMGFNQTLVVQASSGLLSNDFDPEGQPLSVAGLDTSTVPGSISVGLDGSFSYTPPHNFEGTVVFSYSASDGALVGNVQSAAIIVQNPTTPPVANGDGYGTPQGAPLFVAAPGVLGNDFDADGQAMTAVLVDATDFGSLNLQANGAFTYTPNAGFVGNDAFSYRASDGSQFSAVVGVSINVSAVNLPPVPVNDAFQTGRNAALPIAFAGLLANDSDVDGPALFVLSGQFGQPAHGTIQVNVGSSTVVYTPALDYIGIDTFTYRISDGLASSDQSATVRITVTNLVGPTPTLVAGVTPSATSASGGSVTPRPGLTPGSTDPDSGSSDPSQSVSATPTVPYGVHTLPNVGAGNGDGLEGWWVSGLLAAAAIGVVAPLVCRLRKGTGQIGTS